MKLIYDATLIAYADLNNMRTGLFFTALNILNELVKREDIELALSCDYTKCWDLKQNLSKLYPQIKFDIISNNACLFFSQYYSKFYSDKMKFKKNNKTFKKIYAQIMLMIISVIIRLCASINNLFLNKYLNYDAYLSPKHKIPSSFKKCSKMKKTVILYDVVALLYPKLIPISKKGSWYMKLIKSINSKDYYIAISESTRNDFLRFCPEIDPEKIKTVLLAADDKFKPTSEELIAATRNKYNIPNDKKYIFSLCTLEPRKNLIRTVKTFVEFVKKNNIDDLVFVLGGGHWQMFIDKLNKEIENLGDYQDKIIKIGYVDDEDLSPLYSGAEWFTYTSQYEGFGLPPLEAMSCGCPVITSNNSSLPEVVGDAGIMIDWDNNNQHIVAYEKYYFDSNIRKEYSQKGIERAKLFSWNKCVDEILNIINNKERGGV